MSASLLLATALAAAAAVTGADARRSAGTESLVVYEAFDPARPGPLPGVLLLHHDLQGVDEYTKLQARRLAELGYFVLAPALATPEDFGGVPDARLLNPDQARRYQELVARRTEAALRLLREHPRVQGRPLAAVGYCHLGGPAALNLARLGADLAAVAALWGGVNPRDPSPLWPRRKLKPKILVMLGGRDEETNPYLGSFAEEMRMSDADWRLALYGSASHAFTMPDPHPDGRGAYDAAADRRSWADLTEFLDETLRPAR